MKVSAKNTANYRFTAANGRRSKPAAVLNYAIVIILLLFGAELILAYAAKLAGKIFGQFFPFYALFLFVIDPAAYVANIFHSSVSFL